MYSTISQGRKCNLLVRKRNDENMEKGGKYHVIRISILILNVHFIQIYINSNGKFLQVRKYETVDDVV